MAERQLTEDEALHVLRRASSVRVVPLVVGWFLAGMVLVAVRVWLRDTGITDAVRFGGGVAGLALVVQLITAAVRARRLRHTRGWTRLERGTITGREGREVTIRGRGGRSVTAPMQSAWSLEPETPVWVGPGIAAGEGLVVVRDSSGAWASPVHVAAGAARH